MRTLLLIEFHARLGFMLYLKGFHSGVQCGLGFVLDWVSMQIARSFCANIAVDRLSF